MGKYDKFILTRIGYDFTVGNIWRATVQPLNCLNAIDFEKSTQRGEIFMSSKSFMHFPRNTRVLLPAMRHTAMPE